jgi:hypothetical protein
MRAQSFVVGTRALASRVEALLEKPRLEGGEARQAGLAQLADISTLSSLLAAGSPLPVPESAARAAEADLVAELLDHLYTEGVLERAALSDPLRERALASNRVTEHGEFLLVPLDRQAGHEHNWRPVFRLVATRLEAVAEQSERIVSRLEITESSVALRTWRSSLESVQEARTAVKVQLMRQERFRRLYGRPADEPAEFAQWTLDHLSDTPSET